VTLTFFTPPMADDGLCSVYAPICPERLEQLLQSALRDWSEGLLESYERADAPTSQGRLPYMLPSLRGDWSIHEITSTEVGAYTRSVTECLPDTPNCMMCRL
jgi:hypothetical protein